VKGQESLVSILGTHYLQAVARLLEHLLPLPVGPADQAKTPYPENAYSASICVLSAICFESCVMKLRFAHPQHHGPDKLGGAIEYFGLIHPDYPGLEQLRDVFVLRDCLVHNHVWRLDVAWDERLSLKVEDATKAAFSGDKKYAARVDPDARRTRILGLHVVPIEVDRTDAFKVIRAIWSALEFIDSMNLITLTAAMLPLQYCGKKVRFPEVVRGLPDA
jgi:hypothetical protein